MKRTMIGLSALLVGAIAVTSVHAEGRRGFGLNDVDFSTLDATGDGILTAEDMAARATERFESFDADGNGEVTEAEFLARASANAQERATELFDRLDADGDGVLSRDAIEAQRGGDRRVRGFERMIERFDEDGDGGLSEAEFETARETISERRGGRDGPRRN
ncbi:MAG: EF-hand domain-containing protein [Pseudomonadota bacterium]